jgi:hypothetical protein
MDKLKKIYYDLETKVKAKPTKHIIALYILVIISIIL